MVRKYLDGQSKDQTYAKQLIEIKLAGISETFRYMIESVDYLDLTMGGRPNSSSLTITLASLAGGEASIAQATLSRSSLSGHWIVRPSPVIRTSREFRYAVAGISDIAEPILKSLPAGHGDSLSLKGMTDLASDIEEKTANDFRYGRVVGGPIQIGSLQKDSPPQIVVMRGGKPDALDPLFSEYAQPIKVNFLGNLHLVNEYHMPRVMGIDIVRNKDGVPKGFGKEWTAMFNIVGGPTDAVIGIGGLFVDFEQPLSQFLFYDTRFENCVLTYDGESKAVFDSSNTVINSELRVPFSKEKQSPFLDQLRRDFPGLKIVYSADIVHKAEN